MTLGERIKEFRTNSGISQDELAEKMNVSRQAITKWENDKGIPDIDNLIQLSRIMDISLDELVLGNNTERTSALEEKAVQQRNGNKKEYLRGIIGFFIAIVCWIISCILNISSSNDIAAILNAICIIVLLFPIVLLLKKYWESK